MVFWKKRRMVALLYFDTFESEVRNLVSMLEPHSKDSLSHQYYAKSVSTFKSANTLALCQSKPTLPILHIHRFYTIFGLLVYCGLFVTPLKRKMILNVFFHSSQSIWFPYPDSTFVHVYYEFNIPLLYFASFSCWTQSQL